MKRLISLILSISICFGTFAVRVLADDSINDGLSDLSKIESYTDDLSVETKTLGSYENAEYAFSKEAVYEVVYKLSGMASFKVETLNFQNKGTVKFYARSADSEEYTELNDFTVQDTSIDTSWTLKKYEGAIEVDDAEYFKIEIEQTKPKFVRLDSVKIIAQFELEPVGTVLMNNDAKQSGDNVYGANKLKITFNQPISSVPELSITSSDGAAVTASGTKTSDNTVLYEFDALGFDIYKFSASGFETLSKQTYDFEKYMGSKAVYGMPEVVHFGENYTKSGYITEFEDSNGNIVSAENIEISSKDNNIISTEGDSFVFKKAGSCVINASFEINGTKISADRSITLCGVEEITVTPDSMTLEKGESSKFEVKLKLSDGTEYIPENISAEAVDYTVAEIDGNTVKGIGEGSTFVNISVDYYGQTYKAVIAVGVGSSPLPAAKNARLSVNRDKIAVSESIYPVISCELGSGAYADSLSMQKIYHSDDESVVKTDSDGKITAVSEGTANVWADVTVGGTVVETNRVLITVTPDEIVSAELVLPAYYMRTGSTMEASVRVFTKTGAAAEDYTAEYKALGTAVSIEGNTVTAVLAGKTDITVTVECGGKSITSDPVSVEVKNDNGENAKLFCKDTNWNGVFEHSDLLYIYSDTGVMTGPTDARDQYVIFKSDEEISGINMKFYYLTSRHEDDMQVWVSSDNSEGSYVRIPEGKMSVTERIDSGAWYNLWFKYNGEMLAGVRYIKVIIDVHNGENSQGKRLHEMHIEHDNPPETAGVSLINKNGVRAKGTDASQIAVTFSQNIDKSSLEGIKLVKTSDGQEKIFEGTYNDGIYTMNVGTLENTEYKLKISGVKNVFGTEMQPYEFTINPAEANRIEVSNMQISGGRASADIKNNTEKTLSAAVITVTYDENMCMKAMFADNMEIVPGENNYTADCGLEDSAFVKVYVWTDLKELGTFN